MQIDIRPTEILELYHMGVGSQQFVVRHILRTLDDEQIDNPRLRRLIDEAFEMLDKASRYNLMWLQKKDISQFSRGEAVEIDNKLDATLGGIYRLIKVHADARFDSPAKRAAGELLEEMFARGVHPITTMQFENQLSTIKEVLRRFRERYAEHVSLLGLSSFVDNLEQLNDEFHAALSSNQARKLEFSEVKAARKEGEWATTKVLFVVYGDYIEDEALRERLLAGLVDQQRRIRQAMKRRNTVPQVDPDTGDFVDPAVEPAP